MPKFFIQAENRVSDKNLIITGSDVNHIKYVLRKKVGDSITVCQIDTNQNWICEITKLEEETIFCCIKQELLIDSEPTVKVTIFQGLPKADKMEWIIQKSVELGAYQIVPVAMKRSIVKLEGKDSIKKQERWQTIAQVAAKQCGRNVIPKVAQVIKMEQMQEEIKKQNVVLVAYEEESLHSIKQEIEQIKKRKQEEIHIGIVIGPEGGIDQEEILLLQKAGANIITLGKRILRTETVALTMLSIIMYELGDLN